ncbi:raffinose/stachyose/melibiose transport system substrate-binding protein [Cohnella sp. OV330]|uniref:ABC transporter substrate-binding protein n=1 Tax=Cohnella sp. OV330 TaxID=1855288 RepID=UPI0008F09EE1|nr:ABC transporter substrate-binding protein [Cohnella sp. OV330]SFB22551.1 raffinose/stachyose/melibiose transport system substrate-binding protein [Cohnella sp. OV330]
MRKSRALASVMVLAVSAAALAACGGGNGNNNAGGASSPAASGAASAKPAKDPVTLTFVISNTEDTTAFTKIFDAYQQKTGNKVELQALPGGDYDNLIKTRFSTGDFPDLFLMQPGTKQYVKLRADETLHEWSGESGVWDNVIDSIKQAQVQDDKIYGVPYGSTGMMGVFYNKDVFAKAGVNPPANYADLVEIAKKIKAAGVTPFYEGVKDAWPPQVFYYTGWVTQVDPAIGDEGVAKLNANELKLSDIPELKDLFAKQKELKALGLYQDNVMSGTYDELQNEFGEGKVGMTFMLDGIISQLEKKFGKDFVAKSVGFFPFPSATDTGTAMITPPNQLMVPDKAKHAAEAIELVKFMLQPENVDLFYANKPGIPIFKGATSELYPVQEDVKKYIDDGKSKVNIQNRLTPSFVDFSKTLQNFFLDGNIDKAIKEFSDNYQKDGKAKVLAGF